jgi:hypothetical protein
MKLLLGKDFRDPFHMIIGVKVTNIAIETGPSTGSELCINTISAEV